METLSVYLPIDRRLAMARDADLPDRARGAALFADISGFTPLTGALLKELGPKHGAEELTRQLNLVYDAIIAEVHHYGGSVVGFSGDAITCWFDGDDGLRATASGLAMQQTMGKFAQVETPSGAPVAMAIKVAVTTGPVRRFRVGDPQIQYIDVLAGAILDRLAKAEKQAQKGEVVVGPEAILQIGRKVQVAEWRNDAKTGKPFAVVTGLLEQVDATPWPALFLPEVQAEAEALPETQARPWLLPPIYERLSSGQGEFLAEIRPVVTLFLKFDGLAYDQDEDAGGKLDSYIRWAQRTLARYEGYICQLTFGDKGSYLYAVLGAPIAHDDDAARAVAAALELRSPPPELDFITRVQIGISRGWMRTGAYGGSARRTYGALGDEVNMAARLMDKAGPGQILANQPVVDAAAQSYHFEYVGPIQVKGKQEPLQVSLVSGRRLVSQQRPITLFTHRLVGRDTELARMAQLLDSVLAGEGQILRLEGEAGMGKSRLAAEFVEAAIRAYQKSLDIWQSIGFPLGIAVSWSNLGKVCIERGEWERALDYLERSRRRFEEIKSDLFLPEVYRRLAVVHLGLGRLPEARQFAERSVALADGLGMALEKGVSLRVMGQVHLAFEEWDLAEETMTTSLTILEQQHNQYRMGETLYELGRLYQAVARAGGRGAAAKAESALRRARTIFTELGAERDLARIEEVLT